MFPSVYLEINTNKNNKELIEPKSGIVQDQKKQKFQIQT